MRKTRILITILLILSISSISAFAGTNPVDPFKKALADINLKYGVNLEYIPVDNDANLEEYKTFIENVAIMQRETLDYILEIKMNKTSYINKYLDSIKGSIILREKTKTVSSYNASGWFETQAFRGTATYTVAPDNSITSVLSFSANYHNTIGNYLGTMYMYFLDSYTTNYYDSGKTLGITAQGVLKAASDNVPTHTVGNVTTYYMYTDTY